MQHLLANKYWALESGFFERMSPLVAKWLQAGKAIEDFPFSKKQLSSSTKAYDMYDDDDMEEDDNPKDRTPYKVIDNIAVIPIQGTITPKGDWCSYGIDDIVSWIKHANENSNVVGIVTENDSYGGSVSGIQDLYKSIKISIKPVVALICNEMHSAAYWGNAGARHILAGSENSAFAGSIGVYRIHSDWSKYNENEGIKYTYITSEKAIHKTIGNPDEPLSEEALSVFQKKVNRVHEAFIADVEAGRKKAKGRGDANYTGDSWDGAECIERGLVDGIAQDGLQSAIQKAKELADKEGIRTNKYSIFINK